MAELENIHSAGCQLRRRDERPQAHPDGFHIDILNKGSQYSSQGIGNHKACCSAVGEGNIRDVCYANPLGSPAKGNESFFRKSGQAARLAMLYNAAMIGLHAE